VTPDAQRRRMRPGDVDKGTQMARNNRQQFTTSGAHDRTRLGLKVARLALEAVGELNSAEGGAPIDYRALTLRLLEIRGAADLLREELEQ